MCGPVAMSQGVWERDTEGPRRLALLSQTPNVSSARMYTVGRTLQVGERPGRRAKLAAPGKGQGALGHLFTKGRLDPCREAASDHHIQRRQDAERGKGTWQPKGTDKCMVIYTYTCTHTQVYPHVCTHTHKGHSHTCIHVCAHAHTCTPTRTFMPMVHSYILHAHALILTYTRVVISRSWLQWWRFKPPKATCLHDAFL